MAAIIHGGLINGTTYDDSYALDGVGRFVGGSKTLAYACTITGLTNTKARQSSGNCGGPAFSGYNEILEEAYDLLADENYVIGATVTINGSPHRLSRFIWSPAAAHDALNLTMVFDLNMVDEIYYSFDTQLTYESTSWYPNGGVGAWTVGQFKSKDGAAIYMQRPVPVKTMNITRVLYGSALNSPVQQADDYADYINYVNSATWMGLGRGYWKIDRVASQRRAGGAYELTASLSTRIGINWMQLGVPEDPITGRPKTMSANELTRVINVLTNVGGTFNDNDSVSRNQQYENVTYPLNETSGVGVVLTGFHPVANFTTIFGFTDL
jgi:hypothetical protein